MSSPAAVVAGRNLLDEGSELRAVAHCREEISGLALAALIERNLPASSLV